MDTAVDHTTISSHTPVARLARDREQWPADAVAAYRAVLRELDQWSRQHGDGRGSNGWIAEEAVRQSW